MKINSHQYHNTENSLYHFSFLKDIRVYGIYYNSINVYLSQYPFIKKNHFHDFYSILLVTNGEGIIRINNDAYPVNSQSLCLIAPNQVHSFEGLDDVEGTILFFCQDFYVEEFSFIRLLNVFSCTYQIDNKNSKPCIILSDKEFTKASDILKSLKDEYSAYSAENNSVVIMRSLLNIMLLKLSEFYVSEPGKLNKNFGSIIHSLSNLVDSSFIQEQQIGFYTSAFNISERQLNDICNSHFNCGLKKILQDRLMQEARKLLISSELSVAEIAYKLNFEDNSYFNKVFKNKTGITPKRFREVHKNLIP
jgi:AraC family transcriptional regulator, transcriptional activator of pobA